MQAMIIVISQYFNLPYDVAAEFQQVTSRKDQITIFFISLHSSDSLFTSDWISKTLIPLCMCLKLGKLFQNSTHADKTTPALFTLRQYL